MVPAKTTADPVRSDGAVTALQNSPGVGTRDWVFVPHVVHPLDMGCSEKEACSRMRQFASAEAIPIEG